MNASTLGRPAILLALVAALSACGGNDSNDSARATGPTLSAQAACDALQGATVPDSSIALPTKGATVTSATLVAGSDNAGEYCLITGAIASVDAAAQPIKFSAAMPTAWNQRLMQLGSGGFDGAVVDPTSMGSANPSGPSQLARGYVTFGTDGGHTGSTAGFGPLFDASFALNAEQMQNFIADQVKKSHDAMVYLVKQRYGSAPTKSFFMGGSGGGRLALVAVQRYPDDYDGVVAVHPAGSWTSLFMKFQQDGRAMHLNAGAGYVSTAKWKSLLAAQIAACDAQDGVVDGLISNATACTFDVTTLRCPGGADTGDTCFSDAQLATAQTFTSPLTFPSALKNGVASNPGFWPGAYLSTTVYSNGTADYTQPPTQAQLGTAWGLGDQFVRYFLLKNASADVLNFDPADASNSALLTQMSNQIDTTDVDISKFKARGGKLIILHGTADELVHPQLSIDYQQNLVTKFGREETNDFVRLFLVPGYAHGDGYFIAGGGAPLIEMIEQWTLNGVPPTGYSVTDQTPGANRTRPLCTYPSWPKYSGSGDVNSASSFVCVEE